MAKAFLLPIADREPLAWIVREQRTAFAEHRAREAAGLEPGDVLFLYTTRGCFRNPTRDRGRVIGRAVVSRPAKLAKRSVAFGGHEYPHVVELDIKSLAPLRGGVELAPLVQKLRETFPDPATWSVRMRRALVPLAERDAMVIERALQPLAPPYAQSAGSYHALT
jgi:hypothetical protein